MILAVGDKVCVRVRVDTDLFNGVVTSRVDRVTSITFHRDGYLVVDVEPTSIKEVKP